MRNILTVLDDVLAIEGLDPGLGPALDVVRRDAMYRSPEQARELWMRAHATLATHLGQPPKGEPERRAWAVFAGRPVEEMPAPIAEGRP